MTIITKEDGRRSLPFDKPRLFRFIDSVFENHPHLDVEAFKEKMERFIELRSEVKAEQITDRMINNANDLVGIEDGQHPDYQFIAAGIYLRTLYKEASRNRVYDAADKYGNFYGLIRTLVEKGIYTKDLLKYYSKEEIAELQAVIDPERDKLYNHYGLFLVADRYLAKDHDGNLYELPQERHMVIAMNEMINEAPSKRMELVKEAYWAMSNLYMTVATPTMANSGKTYGQLSSCFIETVEDSLDGIYMTDHDIARLSKDGGGIGLYLGYVRTEGATLKGFKGKSKGIVPWAKKFNQTGVAVDQLGTRQGSIALYYPVFGKDIFQFLDLKLNNGDDRFRAHDIFQGVCLPDLFMEQVEKRGDWALFDPKEVLDAKGWYLDDFFDEEKGNGTFRQKYYELLNDPTVSKTIVPAIDIMKRIMKTQLEVGALYHFYRDEVNRMNPNKKYRADGTAICTILCSNLCTEIMQNMSPTVISKEYLTEDYDKIIIEKIPGDFVVCNLSSITLSRAVPDGVLERLIPIQVRMLDNVIDLNEDKITVKQAVASNRKYRAIGLGVSGWHHLLALKGIKWQSERAVKYADELFEDINYLVIKASADLAHEKGSYPAFTGSEWQTGKYFERRGYDSQAWLALSDYVAKGGLRNGYLMAVAPTGSTSGISGTTPGIDPVFKLTYAEEKKNFKCPVTAPDLGPKTIFYYNPTAYKIDQMWSIRQNAARQRHVDQAQSFNLYVTHDVRATELLKLHLEVWKAGIKSSYYIRSTSIEAVEECEVCQ
jgi:ribonucleoside-diphosphate reductase alpha chain